MLNQILKPNSTLLNITPVKENIQSTNSGATDQILSTIKTTPLVYYYNVKLELDLVIKIEMNIDGFLPTCVVTYNDLTDIINNVGHPIDDSFLTIHFPSLSDILPNVFMEFKIYDYMYSSSSDKMIKFYGVANISNILYKEFKSYPNMTSFETLTEICKTVGLGLRSNIDNTSDKMTRINPGMFIYDFMTDTLNKSWISESSFIVGYIDAYYNLNIIDVEKALEEDLKNNKWVLNDILSKNQQEYLVKDSNLSEDLTTPLLIDNELFSTTNLYINNIKINNNSSGISLKRGYRRNAQYYDIDGNWEKKSGTYKIYDVDTITTPNIENKGIILKGGITKQSKDFYLKNTGNYYLGCYDTSNVYPDYLYAKLQNSENLKDLQKVSLSCNLPIPNFNINSYQKVKVLMNSDKIGVPNGTFNLSKINGDWLVVSHTLIYENNDYHQKVSLVKRELEFL